MTYDHWKTTNPEDTCFRQDNTEGYSDAQLRELNRQFEERIRAYDNPTDADEMRSWSDPHFLGRKTVRDHIAEQVLAEFDDTVPF